MILTGIRLQETITEIRTVKPQEIQKFNENIFCKPHRHSRVIQHFHVPSCATALEKEKEKLKNGFI